MNADEAIRAHARWKTLLHIYLTHPDGSIDVNNLQSDCKCDLGRWIYAEGAKYSALPEYTALKDAHAKFHYIAAEIVKKVDAGQRLNPDVEIGIGSAFGKASNVVVNTVKELMKKTA